MRLISINALRVTTIILIVALWMTTSTVFGAAESAPLSPHDSPYDLSFIDMMTMHHSSGIEMARLVESKAKLPQLKRFARKAIADQEKDRVELQSIRNQFYASDPKADKMRIGSMTIRVAEMQRTSNTDIDKLKAAAGSEFDHLFLDIFTKHHQMAIQMSEDAQKNAEQKKVKEFARMTIAKQGKDIKQMDQMKRAVNKQSTSMRVKGGPGLNAGCGSLNSAR